MSCPDTIMDLMRKIKALADDPGATDGERRAAGSKLNALLQKHGLTIDDLAQVEQEWCEFPYDTAAEKQLLIQLAGKASGWRGSAGMVQLRRSLDLLMTKRELADVKELFTFYRKLLKQEMDTFLTAFFHAQNLLAPASPDRKPSDMSEQEALRIARMAIWIGNPKPPVSVSRRIEGGGA